jgi:hypothetical protein
VTSAASQKRFAALPNAADGGCGEPNDKAPMAKATADTSARGAYRDAGPFGYPWMHGCRWRHSKMLVPGAETVSVDRELRSMAAARMDGGIENGRDLE